jgi:hypothetical protein
MDGRKWFRNFSDTIENCKFTIMRKLIVLLSLIVFGGMLSAIGQVISDEEVIELLNGHVLQLDNLTNSNLSFIRQVGDENTAISIQEQEGIVSNLVMMNQDGIGNTGYIEQTGSGLETLLWQYYFTNEANLWSVGKNIRTSVKQDGDGNIINSYIENDGVNSRSATLLQAGNQNRIDLSLTGDGFGNNPVEQTVIINQYGNRHEVKAFMEPFSEPIEINQYPGVGGEGMKVDVSTSTFNFPMKK